MITTQMIYWITRLDYIRNLLSGILAIGIVGCIVCLGVLMSFWMDGKGSYKPVKMFIVFISIVLISAMTMVFTPSTKEMAAMIVIPKIVESEAIGELGNGIKELALAWVSELKPNNLKTNGEVKDNNNDNK